ncbi:sensor histidine kinase [Anaerostipes sp.]|uniref:sensor histidine kinase n=1 Tax=Anaerostipes sp. TaxID=1872530 RepID=UPI0025B83C6E|nr:histidine kinase [Anaerostipes sp.]MBS7009033.1 sensor histidine kinase [Anaerostipes sp.]
MKKAKNLRQKLIPALLISALVPILCLSVFSLIRLRMNMKDSLKIQLKENTEKADKCLNMVLDKYHTILYDLCTDDDVIRIVDEINNDQNDLEVNSSRLRRKLSHICNRNTGINGITIETKKGQLIFYDRLSSSSVNSSWIHSSMMTNVTGYKGFFYSPSGGPVNSGGQEIYQFHIQRKLIDYRDIHKKVGAVILTADESVLAEVINSQRGNEVYLCAGPQIVSSKKKSLIGQEKIKTDQTKYQEAKVKNKMSGWTIVNDYSLKKYHQMIMEQSGMYLATALGIIVLLTVLVYKFTRPVIDSVNLAVKTMSQAETGDFSAKIVPNEHAPDEIQRIASGFNNVVDQVEILLKKVKESAIEQKNAEISVLEAQIDPHFLYNTLDTINWKAIETGQFEVSEMIGALADILRYSVRNVGEPAVLEKEIYWLRQYIVLQKTRMEHELKTEIDIPDPLMKINIHKLLLQPFVENSIKYAFGDNQKDCRIKIKAEKLDGQIHIVISDNGRGIDPGVLSVLNQENAELGHHLGIVNVRKRLKLYYGEEAGLYFESKAETYTKVHMFLPEKEEV